MIEITSPWDRHWLGVLGIGRRTDRRGDQGAIWEATPDELAILETFRQTRRAKLTRNRRARRALIREEAVARRLEAHLRKRERYGRLGDLLRDLHRRPTKAELEAARRDRRVQLALLEDRRLENFVSWLDSRHFRLCPPVRQRRGYRA
jgi:hypothetical protein